MANIQTYIDNIELAAQGEQVRDSIVEALKAINHQGTDAGTLDGHTADEFVLKKEFNATIGDINSLVDAINGEVI